MQSLPGVPLSPASPLAFLGLGWGDRSLWSPPTPRKLWAGGRGAGLTTVGRAFRSQQPGREAAPRAGPARPAGTAPGSLGRTVRWEPPGREPLSAPKLRAQGPLSSWGNWLTRWLWAGCVRPFHLHCEIGEILSRFGEWSCFHSSRRVTCALKGGGGEASRGGGHGQEEGRTRCFRSFCVLSEARCQK